MTITDALRYGTERLQMRHAPVWDARLLLQHVLDVDRAYLIAHDGDWLTADQFTHYLQLLERASRQEPIPYLLGQAPFRDMILTVTPDVLIPRPETEQLVEMVIAWAADHAPVEIVDVGTGSGCIAISLARALHQTKLLAVDASADALAVARANATAQAAEIDFLHGSLLTPLSEPVSAIVANLPYITAAEWSDLHDGVKLYEPELALHGGQDGLNYIRDLLAQAPSKLRPNGAIFLEIGYRQGAEAVRLAQATFPTATIHLHQDYARLDRIVVIELT